MFGRDCITARRRSAFSFYLGPWNPWILQYHNHSVKDDSFDLTHQLQLIGRLSRRLNGALPVLIDDPQAIQHRNLVVRIAPGFIDKCPIGVNYGLFLYGTAP